MGGWFKRSILLVWYVINANGRIKISLKGGEKKNIYAQCYLNKEESFYVDEIFYYKGQNDLSPFKIKMDISENEGKKVKKMIIVEADQDIREINLSENQENIILFLTGESLEKKEIINDNYDVLKNGYMRNLCVCINNEDSKILRNMSYYDNVLHIKIYAYFSVRPTILIILDFIIFVFIIYFLFKFRKFFQRIQNYNARSVPFDVRRLFQYGRLGIISINTCNLCQEVFSSHDFVKITPCSHVFHMVCLDTWERHGCTNCPECSISLQ